jgi:anti-anti-sigma factor
MIDLPNELTLLEEGPAAIARLTGEIDQTNAPAILEHLRKFADNRTLTLDLTATEYFDSAGIAMLDTLRHSTDLRLRVARRSIASRVLSISGMDRIIPVETEP